MSNPALEIPGAPTRHVPIPERNTFVSADYLANPHRDMSQKVYAAPGVPHIVNGVHVTVGILPPEDREFVDADGVILSRERFKQVWVRKYEEFYGIAAASGGKNNLDDPGLSWIPSPERYLTETLNEDGRRVEIGYDPHAPKPETVKRPRRVEDDEPVVDVTAAARMGMTRKPVEEAEADPDPEPTPEPVAAKPERPKVTAPCGKQLKGGLHFHTAKCDACKALEGASA